MADNSRPVSRREGVKPSQRPSNTAWLDSKADHTRLQPLNATQTLTSIPQFLPLQDNFSSSFHTTSIARYEQTAQNQCNPEQQAQILRWQASQVSPLDNSFPVDPLSQVQHSYSDMVSASGELIWDENIGEQVTDNMTSTLNLDNSHDMLSAATSHGTFAGESQVYPSQDAGPLSSLHVSPELHRSSGLERIEYWQAQIARRMHPQQTFSAHAGTNQYPENNQAFGTQYDGGTQHLGGHFPQMHAGQNQHQHVHPYHSQEHSHILKSQKEASVSKNRSDASVYSRLTGSTLTEEPSAKPSAKAKAANHNRRVPCPDCQTDGVDDSKSLNRRFQLEKHQATFHRDEDESSRIYASFWVDNKLAKGFKGKLELLEEDLKSRRDLALSPSFNRQIRSLLRQEKMLGEWKEHDLEWQNHFYSNDLTRDLKSRLELLREPPSELIKVARAVIGTPFQARLVHDRRNRKSKSASVALPQSGSVPSTPHSAASSAQSPAVTPAFYSYQGTPIAMGEDFDSDSAALPLTQTSTTQPKKRKQSKIRLVTQIPNSKAHSMAPPPKPAKINEPASDHTDPPRSLEYSLDNDLRVVGVLLSDGSTLRFEEAFRGSNWETLLLSLPTQILEAFQGANKAQAYSHTAQVSEVTLKSHTKDSLANPGDSHKADDSRELSRRGATRTPSPQSGSPSQNLPLRPSPKTRSFAPQLHSKGVKSPQSGKADRRNARQRTSSGESQHHDQASNAITHGAVASLEVSDRSNRMSWKPEC